MRLDDDIQAKGPWQSVTLSKQTDMKALFVATDFSTASHNAFLYSLQLAHSLEAKVILFHAFQQMTLPNLEPTVVIPRQEMQQLVLDRLNQHLKAAASAVQVPVEVHCAEGPCVATILDEARKAQADLIISGMKESGKGLRQLFGSTVTGLARHSTIPMLVIPEEAGYKQPATIALASDIAPETDVHTLDALSVIGQRFHSKIYIVRVISDRFEEVFELLDRPAKFSRLSRALETQYEYYKNKHVTDTLTDFVQQQQVDLVALVPHQHSLLERLFFKSTTKSMIFKSSVPLLILPEQKISFEPASQAGSSFSGRTD
jgi:nucleotide-binding universal stress UspA family protein